MKKRYLAAAILSISALFAQETNISLPVVPTEWDQIKQYLVLTDSQKTTLEQIRQKRMDDEQAIYRQVAEKQREMYALLQQGSNDAVALGRLLVDINNLNRQLPLKTGPYRTEVLAQLTPEQKAKLPGLVDALKLQAAGWQAIELNIIDNPNVPDVRILPMPLDSVSANSFGNAAGAARNRR